MRTCLYIAAQTRHARLYLLSAVVHRVFGMSGYSGQQAEEAQQSVAVTGREQEYEELDGAPLVCSVQHCAKRQRRSNKLALAQSPVLCKWGVLFTQRVDESCVEFFCQQWVRQVSEKFFQQCSHIMDTVVLIQVYLPSLVKLLTKLKEQIRSSWWCSCCTFVWTSAERGQYLTYSLLGTPNTEKPNCLQGLAKTKMPPHLHWFQRHTAIFKLPCSNRVLQYIPYFSRCWQQRSTILGTCL